MTKKPARMGYKIDWPKMSRSPLPDRHPMRSHQPKSPSRDKPISRSR